MQKGEQDALDHVSATQLRRQGVRAAECKAKPLRLYSNTIYLRAQILNFVRFLHNHNISPVHHLLRWPGYSSLVDACFAQGYKNQAVDCSWLNLASDGRIPLRVLQTKAISPHARSLVAL